MEEIIKELENIVKNELKYCEEKKSIPSDATLDIVKIIMTYRFSQSKSY